MTLCQEDLPTEVAQNLRDKRELLTFDEDRSQVRCGNIPQVMAALRNTTIGLLRGAGYANIAAACRRFAAQPDLALTLIGLTLEN